MDAAFCKPRLRVLLDHFSVIEDEREAWRVAHPLPEVLLVVVCATIASCDDFDDIAAWGEVHLDFLRRFLPYHHGVPTGRWLNILMNRIDPGSERPLSASRSIVTTIGGCGISERSRPGSSRPS